MISHSPDRGNYLHIIHYKPSTVNSFLHCAQAAALPVGSCTPDPERSCKYQLSSTTVLVSVKSSDRLIDWRMTLDVCGEGWVCAHGVSSLRSGLRGRGAIARRGLNGPVGGYDRFRLRILRSHCALPSSSSSGLTRGPSAVCCVAGGLKRDRARREVDPRIKSED